MCTLYPVIDCEQIPLYFQLSFQRHKLTSSWFFIVVIALPSNSSCMGMYSLIPTVTQSSLPAEPTHNQLLYSKTAPPVYTGLNKQVKIVIEDVNKGKCSWQLCSTRGTLGRKKRVFKRSLRNFEIVFTSVSWPVQSNKSFTLDYSMSPNFPPMFHIGK